MDEKYTTKELLNLSEDLVQSFSNPGSDLYQLSQKEKGLVYETVCNLISDSLKEKSTILVNLQPNN